MSVSLFKCGLLVEDKNNENFFPRFLDENSACKDVEKSRFCFHFYFSCFE